MESKEHSLFELNPLPLLLLDLKAKIQRINQGVISHLDLDEDQINQMLNCSFREYLVEEESDNFELCFTEACKGGSQEFETQVNLPSGQQHRVKVELIPKVESGNTDGIYAQIRNFTLYEQKQYQLQRLIDNLPGFVYRHKNEEGYPLELVEGDVTGVLGYSKDELKDKIHKAESVIHPDDRDYVWQSSKAQLNSTGLSDLVYRVITKSGKVRTILERCKTVNDPVDGETKFEGFITDITDKQETERLLAKTNSLARIGYWNWDAEEDKVYTSEVAQQILESDDPTPLSLEENISFFKEGEHRRTVEKAINEILDKGNPYDLDVIICTHKGNERWVRLVGEPEFSGDKCVRVYGAIQDIDRRKRAVMESERNHLLLEAIANQTDTAIWVRDKNGKFFFVNQKYKELFEIDNKKLSGKTLFEVFDKSTAKQLQENDDRIRKYGKSLTFQQKFTTSQGERYHYTNMFLLADVPGLESAIGGVSTDITAQKQAEIQLRFQAHLLDNIGEAVIATNPDGNIIYWNKEAERIYGWRAEEVMNKDINKVNVPEHRKQDSDEVMNRLRSGKSWSNEFEVQHKDGSLFTALVTNSPVLNNSGEVEAIIGASKDITYQKKIEEQLRESLKEKVAMLAEIHHRVKNNLAVISSMILLQAFRTDENKLKSKLLDSAGRIKTMAGIHEQLYQSESYSNVNICENIRKLIPEVVKNNLGTADDIKVDISCNYIKLTVNQAVPFSLIVNEVASNAVKHGVSDISNGRIDVMTKEQNNQLYFELTDNGRGLDKNYKHTKGSSLGMDIIRNLTEQLRGTCNLENREEGGCRFTLNFPIEVIEVMGPMDRV